VKSLSISTIVSYCRLVSCCGTCWCLPSFCLLTRPVIVGRLVSFVVCGIYQNTGTFFLSIIDYPMADHSLADTACTTDSSQATGSGTSSVSSSGLATRTLSSESSATAMARFSLDLRDLEAASALGALGNGHGSRNPMSQHRSTSSVPAA